MFVVIIVYSRIRPAIDTSILSIWVEIYLRTGEWMWRCDAEYKQERMHGET